MHPLKLTITGHFWDSQIYSGRLYLFGTRGDIVTLDWDRLIQEWELDSYLKVVLQCAFCRSDYLYGNRWTLLFTDAEVKSLIQAKFAALAQIDLTVSTSRLQKVRLGQQDTPFPFPHSDSTIFRKQLYVGSSQGVHVANCNKQTKYPVSTRAYKRWDGPVLAVAASYYKLAFAAGSDGLYELSLNGYYANDWSDGPKQLFTHNCISCRWVYYSIYSSSHVAPGFLASFIKTEGGNVDHLPEIKFDQLVEDHRIFRDKGYSWGTQDKLCQAKSDEIHVIRYSPWETNIQERFEDLGKTRLEPRDGEVVSGGVGLFGTIVEYNDALVIVPSEGSLITLKGEPINWRIFPKSKHYQNQLHVIYEDRVEIFSFNHDYFVDQKAKRSGIRFSERAL